MVAQHREPRPRVGAGPAVGGASSSNTSRTCHVRASGAHRSTASAASGRIRPTTSATTPSRSRAGEEKSTRAQMPSSPSGPAPRWWASRCAIQRSVPRAPTASTSGAKGSAPAAGVRRTSASRRRGPSRSRNGGRGARSPVYPTARTRRPRVCCWTGAPAPRCRSWTARASRSGQDDAEALRATVRRARRVEALGADGFWVAEHHAVPGVVGPAPTVLLAAVAAATSRVRVGTAGVMLPNHRPFVVAEQVAVLAALHPGRVWRSGWVARWVHRAGPARAGAPTRAPTRTSASPNCWTGCTAGAAHPAAPRPGAAGVALATGEGLRTAARLGLPVVVGGRLLREATRCGATAEHPAGRVPAPRRRRRPRRGGRAAGAPAAGGGARPRPQPREFGPLPTPDEAAAASSHRPRARRRRAAPRRRRGRTAQEVRTRLQELLDRTGADELLLAATPHDEEVEAATTPGSSRWCGTSELPVERRRRTRCSMRSNSRRSGWEQNSPSVTPAGEGERRAEGRDELGQPAEVPPPTDREDRRAEMARGDGQPGQQRDDPADGDDETRDAPAPRRALGQSPTSSAARPAGRDRPVPSRVATPAAKTAVAPASPASRTARSPAYPHGPGEGGDGAGGDLDGEGVGLPAGERQAEADAGALAEVEDGGDAEDEAGRQQPSRRRGRRR